MCFLFGNLAQRDSKRVSDSFAVSSICLQTVDYMADFDFLWHVSQGAGRITKEDFFLPVAHKTKEHAGLAEIVLVLTVVPVVGGSLQRERRFGKFRLLFPFTIAVGLVTERAAVVAVHPHGAIAMVAVERTSGGVHRNKLMLHAAKG